MQGQPGTDLGGKSGGWPSSKLGTEFNKIRFAKVSESELDRLWGYLGVL